MARHEMIDGVMKKLMRGIKIAAEPINQHNCAYNDTGAISNSGQCAGSKGGGVLGRGTEGGEGDRHGGQSQEHTDDVFTASERAQLHLTCKI